jgi:uncharacterized membrane protein (DUF373 family)
MSTAYCSIGAATAPESGLMAQQTPRFGYDVAGEPRALGGHLVKRPLESLLEILGWGVVVVEILVAICLVAMAFGAVWELALELFHVGANGMALPIQDFNRIIGTVLEVFIVVELFRIAVAYMRHQNVLPTVLEAALVAVARKFVVFEGAQSYLQYAVGLAALLLAVAVSWYLLDRSGACELES